MIILYKKTLEAPLKLTKSKAIMSGLQGGLMICIIFVMYALILLIGSRLIQSENLSIENLFRAMFALIFSISGFAGLAFVMPDITKAFVALNKIFEILDTPSKINANSEEGLKPSNFKGRITFKNVTFSYPTRPTELVFKNLNLEIEPGKKIGIVGESGCGKSTILQLILRFYDVQHGYIEIDGININEYNIKFLRS